MKRIFTILMLLLTIFCFAGCGSTKGVGKMSQKDFLKAVGKEIRKNSGAGEAIILKGTNVGGYLLQEFWMTPVSYGTDLTDQTDVIRILSKRFGSEKAFELIALYEDNYFTEDDFINCSEMGMNVLRLPFWWRNLMDEEGNFYGYDASLKDPYAAAFRRIDDFIALAGKYGLYVILDMHGVPGSQNGSDHSGVDGHDDKAAASEFFFGDKAKANQELFYSLWEVIANRYKGNPVVAGYDLMNEPYCTYRYSKPFGMGDTQLRTMLWDIYDAAYQKIRAVDPDHILIMEATWDPVDLPSPSRYGWENIIYEYHNYLYDDYDNKNGQQLENMKKKLKAISNRNFEVPSYLGEFSFFNNIEAWDDGLTLLDEAGISYTTWTYKTTATNGNWGIYHHQSSMNTDFNLQNMTKEAIESRFSSVGTVKGKVNEPLYEVLKKHFGN